jgi:hypothetical protein
MNRSAPITLAAVRAVFPILIAAAVTACGGTSDGSDQISVPNVVGDTQAAATTALTGAGLTIGAVTQASSTSIASGDVLSESPAAASSVTKGSAVALVVSSGPPPVSVPNVVGDTQAAAATTLTGAGLKVGTVTQASSATVTNGNVISETPAAGSSVANGTAVALAISTGPQPTALALNGTAAVGLPIVGATVSIVCSGLSTVSQTQTDSSGNWQISIPGAALACALELTGGTIDGLGNTTAYHSIATSSGTNNITPLTDLMVANVAGTAALQTWFAALTGPSTSLAGITSTQVNQAWVELGQDMPVLGSAIANPITMPFTSTTGNAMDRALSALAAGLSSTGVSYPVLLGNLASNTTPISGLSSTVNAFYSAIVTPPTNSGSGSFTVGGTVTGLPGDFTIFVWNGNDTLAISSNGAFSFPSTLSSGATYAVNDAVPVISGQVPNLVGDSCTITNGSGTITTANVTNVTISCSTYQLNPLTENSYWGILAYDSTSNLGVLSYNYPTLTAAQTQATLTCTQDGGSCGNVSFLTLGVCAAVASRPLTGQKPSQPQYAWGSGFSGSSLSGANNWTLAQALQSAQSQALQNCSSPPVSTAVQTSPPAAPAACSLVVSGCVDGTTPGVATGGISSGGQSGGSALPTHFSGTFTASGNCYIATSTSTCAPISDSGSFSGTFTTASNYPVSVFENSISVSSSLSPAYSTTGIVPGYGVTPNANNATYGPSALGTPLPTTAPNYYALSCENITWSTGPFAGQSGTSSTGTGTLTESSGLSDVGVYPEYNINGTCTVTVE